MRIKRSYAKRYVLGPFTDWELKVIQLRTNGVKTPEIAKRLGVPTNTVYHWLWSAYKKAGVDDVALLTRWAIKNALDEEMEDLPPEPKVKPKRGRKKIKLGRIRSMRLTTVGD